MYVSLNFLKLVYPPISNQFAERLSDVSSVREYVKHSKLYALAQRHEVLFSNYFINEESRTFNFDLVCGSVRADGLSISIDRLVKDFDGEYEFEAGSEAIKIVDIKNIDKEPIYWATTDKLLYDFWRKKIRITGLRSIDPFTSYNLYYVGISKDNDSFTRLFNYGHKNRLKILSNETQYSSKSRLTDEIYIFLFDIEDFGIKELNLDKPQFPKKLDKSKLIADAEKAFIKILDCKYNKVKYKNYPHGRDGLADEGLTSYGYFLNEDITFATPTATIRGVYDIQSKHRYTDWIKVENDKVELVTSELIGFRGTIDSRHFHITNISHLSYVENYLKNERYRLNGTRVQRYLKIIENFSVSNVLSYQDTWALVELNYLYLIIKVAERTNKIERKMISDCIDGSHYLEEEKSSNAGNAPRNYTFQLYITAKMLAFEMDILIPSLGKEADIRFIYNKINVPVECKRLYAIEKVKQLTKDVCKQVSGRVVEGYGIAVLDLSRAIWSIEDGMIIESEHYAREATEDFYNTWRNDIRKILKQYPKVALILISMNVPCVGSDDRYTIYEREFYVTRENYSQLPESDIVKYFIDSMRSVSYMEIIESNKENTM